MPLSLDLSVLSAFTLLWLAVVPTPGPNVLMVTHVAVTRTPAHVAFAIAGNLAGIALLALLALVGWAAVLETFPWLRRGVNILGGLYLTWVGWKLIRRSRIGHAAQATATATAAVPATVPVQAQAQAFASASVGNAAGDTPADYRRTATMGLVTALSNAQAILFITSIYAVAGVLNANFVTGFATVLIMLVCNATYLAMLGWLFQRESMRAGYARLRGLLEGTIGSLFVLFGGRLLWRGLDD